MPETAVRVDPALAFRFEVKFDGLPAAGFSECTGLQADTEVMEYVEGGLNTNVHRLPTRTRHGNLTLKRGVVDATFWRWYDDLVRGLVSRRGGTLLIYAPNGVDTAAEWQIRNAFPAKWSGPDLSASQNSVAVETVEIAHEGLTRVR